ncbi:MAG: DUF302 domain-containing protein [Candidatus Kerfeldbacteria bacterium]|nr:DUF302 domain-containing protein [Candidatus Kerfeldbacteria bacterium]
MKYSYTKQVNLPFSEAVGRTKAALAREGFGVLTEIDVKAALKQKLNVDYDNYLILGVCNPPLAYQALQLDRLIGLFLPCNVIVYEDGGQVFASAILPTVAMGMIDNPALQSLALEAEDKLKRAIDNL